MAENEYGNRLRELRGSRSPDAVSQDLQISKSALYMYERGERRPRDEIKARISQYYGVSVQELFFTQNEH